MLYSGQILFHICFAPVTDRLLSYTIGKNIVAEVLEAVFTCPYLIPDFESTINMSNQIV